MASVRFVPVLLPVVALLAEGVDRNWLAPTAAAVNTCVALLAEGVDRNQKQLAKNGGLTASPSSRRAWIEISRQTVQLS